MVMLAANYISCWLSNKFIVHSAVFVRLVMCLLSTECDLFEIINVYKLIGILELNTEMIF